MPATLQRLPAPPSGGPRGSGQTIVRTLIDELLAEQKLLQTPVARFAEAYDRSPDLAAHYKSLIPLGKPGPGEQYAFEVALDRCTGCKACVSACHSLNGLDDHEAWRDVGLLLGGDEAPGWQQTITTACHHCADPACMNGCPVGAYEKDAETGIVRHLDDQCIGCSYCILKCPYDVPKYSKKRGIVRKCDMCHQRLADGEAPACVQACPTEAIRIITVGRATGMVEENTASLFSSAIPYQESSALPSSAITLPTTRYVGRDVPDTAFAADRASLTPQHPHWPLIVMLVFTQAGIGLISMAASLQILIAGSLMFYAGMAASVLHLGQPLKAWRFFLGLKRSWLSREILAFSLLAPFPFLLALPESFPGLAAYLPVPRRLVASGFVVLGLAAVFTSVMIYQDTRRTFWRFSLGGMRFFGTVASFAALALLLDSPSAMHFAAFSAIVMFKLLPELLFLRLGMNQNAAWSADVHSARCLLGPLRSILYVRISLALAAVALAFIPWIALPLLLLAELMERRLFFQAVYAPKMPGHFGPAAGHS